MSLVGFLPVHTSSSLSCRAASTDIPDSLSLSLSLSLSHHLSLSFIASGRSSGQHPVSSQSCCMYIRAGRPAFAQSYVGVHRSTLLMSSSLLLQQCPACLVRLTWIVFVMGGRWPYSWGFMGSCLQDPSKLFDNPCYIIAEGYFYIIIFRFIYLTFRFGWAENLSA